MEISDAPRIFRLIEQNRIRLREWFPWLDQSRCEQDTRDFIEIVINARVRGERYDAVIVLGKSVIGMLGFNKIDKATATGTIGYWLDEGYVGQGILTHAMQDLIRIGFLELGLETLEVRASPRNTKSCNVALRAGFTYLDTVSNAEWLYDHYEDNNRYVLSRPKGRSGQG